MTTSTLSRPVSALLNICRRKYLCAEKNIVGLAKLSSNASYETLSVSVPHEFVYHVSLNRPEKLNALNRIMWIEIGKCFNELDENEDCRVIILSGIGKIFCAGIDLMDLMDLGSKIAAHDDVARKAKVINSSMVTYQNVMSSLEICKKPVLTAVHSGCIGGGVNLIAAADMRYCSKDAWFQLKEVDVGMAADVGALQRLPKIVGSDSLVREFCYTARKMDADEALSCGLVSRVFENKEKMLEEVLKIAQTIASKSPVAVQGTKKSIVYSRDHTVQEGLDQIALWNQLMLQSEDLMKGTIGQINKDPNIKFSKL